MANSKNITAKIVVAFLGVVAALAAVEIIFRLLPQPRGRQWSDRPKLYFMPAESRGNQDAAYGREKPSGVFRAALLGDSFVFGPHLQLDDTLAKRLERWLNLNEGGKAEVLSFGVSAFSTHHQVAKLKDALQFNPDLVILEITLNDAEPGPLTKEKRDEIFGLKLLEYSLFRYWRSAGFVLQRLQNSRTHRLYIDYFKGLYDDPALYGRFSDSLKQIAEQCKVRNVRLAAVVYPLFSFPLDRRYPFSEVHGKIHHALHTARIPFLDLLDSYQGIPNERLEVIPGSDGHPGEIANRIAAESLLEWLARRELLPQELLPQNVYRRRKDHNSPRAAHGALLTGRRREKPEGRIQAPGHIKGARKQDAARRRDKLRVLADR